MDEILEILNLHKRGSETHYTDPVLVGLWDKWYIRHGKLADGSDEQDCICNNAWAFYAFASEADLNMYEDKLRKKYGRN